jgi:hypothetical protein
MPWRGSTYSHDTQEQTRALANWFGRAIAHPMLVGAHFFPFRDHPPTGRGDGEATLYSRRAGAVSAGAAAAKGTR